MQELRQNDRRYVNDGLAFLGEEESLARESRELSILCQEPD